MMRTRNGRCKFLLLALLLRQEARDTTIHGSARHEQWDGIGWVFAVWFRQLGTMGLLLGIVMFDSALVAD